MGSISRTISIWVILAMAATLPGTQAFAFSSAPMAMAGCHSHHADRDPGPAAPAPEHGQYQCCANGHHWAIPVAFAARPMLAVVDWNTEDGSNSASLIGLFEAFLLNPAVSPPAASPLRI